MNYHRSTRGGVISMQVMQEVDVVPRSGDATLNLDDL